MGKARLKVKGVLLDLDGTLFDTRPAYLEAAEIACNVTAREILPDTLALEIPKRMEQRHTLTGIIEGDTKAFVHAYLNAFYKVSRSKTKPMPNAAKTLYN